MRHQKRKRNLGMSPSHRSSLLVNLAASILDKERIVTTLAKAKEVRGTVERLITYGKRGGLHAMRLAARAIQNKDLLHKLFTDIAPSFKEREGGYTRIIKIGERKGDNAMTVFIELVGRSAGEIARMRKKQKKQQAGQPDVKAPKSETPAQSTEAPAPQKEPKAKKEKPESKKKESVKAKKPKESAAAGHEKKEAPAAEKPEKPAKAKKTEPAKKKKADKE
jgi:large subunit ribosomal protein L17